MSIRMHRADDGTKPTRHYSKAQETDVAKTIGAETTKNSGATMFDKGDLKSDKFLIECKTKTKDSKSIAIQKEWLTKLKQESLFMGKKYEALVFNFGPDTDNYAIIDMHLFEELKNYLESE